MSRARSRAKEVVSKPAALTPHPKDARHVRRAFEDAERDPKAGTALTPEQIREWAESGKWPASSD